MRNFLLVLVSLLSGMPLWAAGIPEALPFEGDIKDGKKGEDVSAVVATDNFLIMGSDEGASIQVIDRKSDGGLKAVSEPIPLLEEGEADIEGIALGARKNGRFPVFVIGCHCKNRKTLKDNEDHRE